MAFQRKPVPWIDLNDMALLYEDAGLTIDDISARFHLRKSRVLELLRRMGVPIRKPGQITRIHTASNKYGHTTSTTVKSKTTYTAFLALQLWLRQCRIDGEVGMAGLGGGFQISFGSMSALERMLDLVVADLPMDEDVDSLYVAITKRWEVSGNIVLVGEDNVERIDVRPTITMNASDLVTLAGLVTS
jgi:hypothetical protein